MSTTPKTDAFVRALRARGVEVLTQDQWGGRTDLYRARIKTKPHALLPGRPVDTLWNHITVTHDDGKFVGEFKADCREVERIGLDRFGTGVSYNILVDANGDRPRVAIGQFFEVSGAHTLNEKGIKNFSYNQNKYSLAVAWIGVPGDKLNDHAVFAEIQLRAALHETGCLTDTYDDVPHSLVAAKDCPTNEVRNRLPALRKAGFEALKDTPAAPPGQAPAAGQSPTLPERPANMNQVQYGRWLIAQGIKVLRTARLAGKPRPQVNKLADAVQSELDSGIKE